MSDPVKVQPDANTSAKTGFMAGLAAMLGLRSSRIDSPEYKMRRYSKNRVGTHSRNRSDIGAIRARNKRERQNRVRNRNARIAQGLRA